MTNNRITKFSLAVLVVVVAAVGITLAVMSARADDRYPTIPTWPPFTMVYETDGMAVAVGTSPARTTREVRRLEYVSRTQWTDTVLDAPTITTPVGQSSRVGSYAHMDSDTFTEFDASTGSMNTETVPETTLRGHGAVILPFPIEESGVKFTRTTTEATVCFRDECEENAQGLLYVKPSGTERVFVDDARGIPLRVSDALIVREIRINDNRQPVALRDDNGTTGSVSNFREVPVGQTIRQGGVSVTLEALRLGENETYLRYSYDGPQGA